MPHKQLIFRASAREKVLRGIGAPSETELKRRKEAFDDALSATKAAMAEGIGPGGGLALLRAIEPVERGAAQADGDEATGMLILRRALEVPIGRSPTTSQWTAGW